MTINESARVWGVPALTLALILGARGVGRCDDFEKARAGLKTTFGEYTSALDETLSKIRAGAESLKAKQLESFIVEVKAKGEDMTIVPRTQIAAAGRWAEFLIEPVPGVLTRKFTLLILKEDDLYRIKAESTMFSGRCVEQYFLPGRPVEMPLSFGSFDARLEIVVKRAPKPDVLSDAELNKMVSDSENGLAEIDRKARKTKEDIRRLEERIRPW